MIRRILAALLLAPTIASADPLSLGVGVGIGPQFPGSADYRVFPTPFFSFDLGPVSVRSNGPGAEANVPLSRAVAVGPLIRWNGGRDPAKIDNAQVSALPKVDGAFMLGAFTQLNFPIGNNTFLSPRLSFLQGLDGGHEGFLSEGSLGVTRVTNDWTYGGRALVTYADASYMDAFFTVAPASPSGLAAFDAGPGIKDVGFSLFANYKLSDNWSATAIFGYKRLLGDAADSPIVSVAGSENQALISLGVSYTFN